MKTVTPPLTCDQHRRLVDVKTWVGENTVPGFTKWLDARLGSKPDPRELHPKLFSYLTETPYSEAFKDVVVELSKQSSTVVNNFLSNGVNLDPVRGVKLLRLLTSPLNVKIDYDVLTVVTDDYIRRLKCRTAMAMLTGSVDPLIVPLLTELNRVPGIATVWSCSAHPSENRNRFYVLFYRTEIGDGWIDDWVGDIKRQLSEDPNLRSLSVGEHTDHYRSALLRDGSVSSRRSIEITDVTLLNQPSLLNVVLTAASNATVFNQCGGMDASPKELHVTKEDLFRAGWMIKTAPCKGLYTPFVSAVNDAIELSYDAIAPSFIGLLIKDATYYDEDFHYLSAEQLEELNVLVESCEPDKLRETLMETTARMITV